MLHPLELMSLVVGKRVIDWTEMEKVLYVCACVYVVSVLHVHVVVWSATHEKHENFPRENNLSVSLSK